MKQVKGKVLSNREVKPGYFLMSVECPPVARAARPGQFLTIRCGDSAEPLLRRPFGFHGVEGGSFRILYEVLGKGTAKLSSAKAGDTLDILGPLGKGFMVPEGRKNIVIIAGGIGVAPLAFLAEEILKDKKKCVSVIIGARGRNSLLCREHFEGLGIKTLVATDDGSCGRRCFATDLLERSIAGKKPSETVVYACGPSPMLKTAANAAKKRGIEAYGSFEEYIACGVGACLGCAIRTKSGYKLICKDGPVFKLEEMIW
ncbi:MAG TPA: dihydroorotate dehydrogenase electron transfer subunit [Candidatus Omnitrophota bacterium]|nr:dihydroorotate dehydrogenase electron transfer subunit [Candidatus Omnitrophota bacterium]HPN65863.1 dihydroorotate dehydrogenase electron transfer subunit [Candidatus Omnitrophota bacterium]HRZ66553.1 dihydroorotate dehydrogenase electron transfer subunit [Candidatus Omnitrophota bacterium]